MTRSALAAVNILELFRATDITVDLRHSFVDDFRRMKVIAIERPRLISPCPAPTSAEVLKQVDLFQGEYDDALARVTFVEVGTKKPKQLTVEVFSAEWISRPALLILHLGFRKQVHIYPFGRPKPGPEDVADDCLACL